MSIDADLYRSDSLQNVLGSLTGPLASGAAATPVTPNNQGGLVIDWTTRRPAVLVSLAKSLDTETVTLTATVSRGGAGTPVGPVTFAPYSEQGATLALYVPALAAGVTTVPPVTIALQVTAQPLGGFAESVAPETISSYLGFTVVEGNMGKLLFLLTSEKARIRREGRRLAAGKLLGTATLDALDRIGADLGVPRFQDDLVYDRDHRELKTVILTDAAGNPTLEADRDYARRLEIYRGFLLASPARVLDMLNGPGAAGAPNSGLLSGLGVTSRFSVSDRNNPFALAIRIVGAGTDTPFTNFINYLQIGRA